VWKSIHGNPHLHAHQPNEHRLGCSQVPNCTWIGYASRVPPNPRVDDFTPVSDLPNEALVGSGYELLVVDRFWKTTDEVVPRSFVQRKRELFRALSNRSCSCRVARWSLSRCFLVKSTTPSTSTDVARERFK
jgi:hypothetical protein